MSKQTRNATEEIKEDLGMQTDKKSAPKTITDLIVAQKEGFKLALPDGWDADRFVRIAITAIKNNPKLQNCEPYSVLGSLMLSAQLGLEPNSPLHEASLIPYKGQAQFQIEYRGLLKLVYNSGMVEAIDYDKVCEGEPFKFTKGFKPVFDHDPSLTGLRNKPYGYYACAELKGGTKIVHYMTKEEVMEHGKRFSKSFDNSPWQTDFDAMAIKTVLKQLADKKLPKKTTNEALKFQTALDKDEKVSTINEDQLNKKIDLDDIETEPAQFEDIKTDPDESVENWEYAPFIIEKIFELKTLAEINKFKKDHKKDIEAIGGQDAEMIVHAFKEVEDQILTKKKENK